MIFCVRGFGQDVSPSRPEAGANRISAGSTSVPAASESLTEAGRSIKPPSPAEFYGLWSIAPAVVAIGLAMITRQVILALPLGILTGAVMLSVMSGVHNPIEMVRFSIEHYLFGVLFPIDPDNPDMVDETYKHLQTIVFTQFIGAMIGVIEANGGTRAMVARVTHLMKTRVRGQLGAWAAGIIIFFDDYANALIIGPAMRPVFDRLRLSREKLSYIVDSTAAPVASLFIGTWLAAEINFLDTALAKLGDARPAFLLGLNGAACFWGSIPYRTYAILAIFMVFMIAVTGRDFGPMRAAESRAAGSRAENNQAQPHDNGRRWLLGLLPVLVLVLMTVTLLMITGRQGCEKKGLPLDFASVGAVGRSIMTILGQADSYVSLLYSALAAAVVAVVSTLLGRALKVSETFDAVTRGMSRVFGAQIILILAWGLSNATKDLQVGEVAATALQDLVDRQLFAVSLLPLSIFVTAGIVSFATGTSWGTMGILCPTTIAIAARLLAPLPVEQAMPLFYACVGSVLTGAVFGDHCSPVSDTTVLSAITSECPLEAHVRTQLPYALVAAIAGALCTDLLDHFLVTRHPAFYHGHWNVYYGTALGALLLWLVVLIAGRRPKGLVVEPAVVDPH